MIYSSIPPAADAVARLRQKGFFVVDEDNLDTLCRQHPRLVVLLQSQPERHPEVADSWVIVPEVINHFPEGTFIPAVADIAFSETLAMRYRVLKFPAVLFFQQGRFAGAVSGLLDWAGYLAAFEEKCRSPLLQGDIAVDVHYGDEERQ